MAEEGPPVILHLVDRAELEAAEAELQRIKDDSHRMTGACCTSWSEDIAAREQAEAERDRLREALNEIAHTYGLNQDEGDGNHLRHLARLALSSTPGAGREERQA